MGKVKIKEKDLKRLISKNLKDSEIAEILNFKTISVYFARKRYNIIREPFSTAKNIPLSKKQIEFFVGCLLGDGSLRIDNKCINPRFTCEHSIKQEEYIKYKFNLIKNLNSFIRNAKRFDKRTNREYKSIVIRTNTNQALLELYNEFYSDKVKKISKKILNYYTPFAMAIHYMDDGYLTPHSYRIATNCFDRQSLSNLQNKLLEYNIKSSIHARNVLYIKAESKIIFTKLIEEFFPDSMKYKLHRI